MNTTKKIALTFYRDWYDAIHDNGLSKDKQLACYDAIFRYAFFDEEPSDSFVRVVTSLMRSSVTREKEKQEAISKKRAESGKKGAEATNGKCRQMSANAANADFAAFPYKEQEQVLVQEQVQAQEQKKKNNNKKKSRYVVLNPPTAEEVYDYAQQRGHEIDANYFVDYYSKVGWKSGSKPIVDWKAAVRNWITNQTRYGQSNYQRSVEQHDAEFVARMQYAIETIPED